MSFLKDLGDFLGDLGILCAGLCLGLAGRAGKPMLET